MAPTRRQIETRALHVPAIITLLGDIVISRSGDVMQSTVKGPTGAKARLQQSPLFALVSRSLVDFGVPLGASESTGLADELDSLAVRLLVSRPSPLPSPFARGW